MTIVQTLIHWPARCMGYYKQQLLD